MGGREKEGGEKRARAGGDRGVRGRRARSGARQGGEGGKGEREKERERFAAVERDASRWMGKGWDVL